MRPRALVITILLLLALPGFALAGEDADLLVFAGADLHYRGEIDAAMEKFNQALALDPDNTYARNQLGLLFVKKGNFDAAFNHFSRVAAKDPDNIFAYQWLGILYLRGGELEQAHKMFDHMLARDPNNAEALYFLGTLYNFRHNPAKAIEYLKKARDADSGEAETHYRLAGAFADADMEKNALLEYQRALKLNPNHTRALNAMGWLLYNQGDQDGAIKAWQEVLAKNPKDRDAVLNLAKAYNARAHQALQAGDAKSARQWFGKTLAVHPSNKAAKHFMDHNR